MHRCYVEARLEILREVRDCAISPDEVLEEVRDCAISADEVLEEIRELEKAVPPS